jgi:hypothetical protein
MIAMKRLISLQQLQHDPRRGFDECSLTSGKAQARALPFLHVSFVHRFASKDALQIVLLLHYIVCGDISAVVLIAESRSTLGTRT